MTYPTRTQATELIKNWVKCSGAPIGMAVKPKNPATDVTLLLNESLILETHAAYHVNHAGERVWLYYSGISMVAVQS